MPSPKPFNVRDARPEDRAQILQVTLNAYVEYAEPLGPGWLIYRENIVETLAHPEPALQFVAADGTEILGTVLLYSAGIGAYVPGESELGSNAPEVRLLAVDPKARRRGIARALMNECIAHTRAQGADVLQLHTVTFMQAAVRLYESMGFVRAEELDFRPVPEFLIMGYRLALN